MQRIKYMGLPSQGFYCRNFGHLLINCLKKLKQQANVAIDKGSHMTDIHETRVKRSEHNWILMKRKNVVSTEKSINPG